MFETSWIAIPGERADRPLLDVSMAFDAGPLSLMLLAVSLVVALAAVLHDWPAFSSSGGRARTLLCAGSLLAANALMLLSANLLQLFLFWQLTTFAAYRLLRSAETSGPGRARNRERNTDDREFRVPNSTLPAPRSEFSISRLSTSDSQLLSHWIADIPLLLGVCLAWTTFETLSLDVLLSDEAIAVVSAKNAWAVDGLCLCLLAGALGRCAQWPLHLWLLGNAGRHVATVPPSHQAATPVPATPGIGTAGDRHASFASVLIQGAALMPGGVFLIARLHPLFSQSPAAQSLMLVLGGLTAFLSAAVAVAAAHPQRGMAAVSSALFGMMFVGLGSEDAAAASAAILLLLTHSAGIAAWCLLFDGSRYNRIHDANAPANRGTGNLARWSVAIAGLALVGGMCGQNVILSSLWEETPSIAAPDSQLAIGASATAGHPQSAIFWPLTLSMFLIAVALFRVYFRELTAEKQRRQSKGPGEPAPSPNSSAAIAALTLVTAIAGPLLGGSFAAGRMFRAWLPFGLESSASDSSPLFAAGFGLPVALAGVVVAWMVYATADGDRRAARIAAALGPLSRLCRNAFYLDDVVRLGLLLPLAALARVVRRLDVALFERLIPHLCRAIPRRLADALAPLETGVANFYALSALLTVAVLLILLLQRGG